MSEVEWTNDAAIRLIQEYEKRPELWDSANELYRVQTAKYEAWADMAKVFQCDIADLRKKLNSIFASHRREKSKVRSGGRSFWFLYHHMKFLPGHLENTSEVEMPIPKVELSNTRKAKQIISEPSDNEVYQEEAEEVDYLEEDDSDNQEVFIKQEPPENRYLKTYKRVKYQVPKTHKPRIIKTVKKRLGKESDLSELDSRLLETVRLLRRSELSRKKDECDSFGEYIADSLRKHDERTQSMIKQAINNILFEQEMKKYSSGYTVVISGTEENPLVLTNEPV